MSILVASDLACEKSDRRLFTNINFNVDKGQLWHLKGDNGAGKTSLIRILVGLSQPQAGAVTIDGIDVFLDQNTATKQVIYLAHKAGISSSLSALENLTFWLSQQDIPTQQSKIIDVLDTLELTGLEDIPTKNLSAGQQRRVGLAKLWLKPTAKLWVLDEPFTSLDVHMIDVLQQHMTMFLEQNGAIVMTSHQPLSLASNVNTLELAYQW